MFSQQTGMRRAVALGFVTAAGVAVGVVGLSPTAPGRVSLDAEISGIGRIVDLTLPEWAASSEVMAQVGDHVVAGQLLARAEVSLARRRLEYLRNWLDALETRRIALLAELHRTPSGRQPADVVAERARIRAQAAWLRLERAHAELQRDRAAADGSRAALLVEAAMNPATEPEPARILGQYDRRQAGNSRPGPEAVDLWSRMSNRLRAAATAEDRAHQFRGNRLNHLRSQLAEVEAEIPLLRQAVTNLAAIVQTPEYRARLSGRIIGVQAVLPENGTSRPTLWIVEAPEGLLVHAVLPRHTRTPPVPGQIARVLLGVAPPQDTAPRAIVRQVLPASPDIEGRVIARVLAADELSLYRALVSAGGTMPPITLSFPSPG